MKKVLESIEILLRVVAILVITVVAFYVSKTIYFAINPGLDPSQILVTVLLVLAVVSVAIAMVCVLISRPLVRPVSKD